MMKTPILLAPKIDFVFKQIFGNEHHPNILISFLNAVLNDSDQITSVTLKNPEIERDFIDDKNSRLDIRAVTNTGKHINIEIQLKNEYNIVKRSLYYWSKLYEEQLTLGRNYSKLNKTICINLLDFTFLPTHNYHSTFRLHEIDSKYELTDILEIHFIELKKFKGVSQIEQINEPLEAWVQFITAPESEVIMKLEEIQSEIQEAKEELMRLSGDKKTREEYRRREESLIEKISGLESALERGHALGFEEGVKQTTFELAKSLLDVLDNETIALKTGLSITEVQKLRQQQISIY